MRHVAQIACYWGAMAAGVYVAEYVSAALGGLILASSTVFIFTIQLKEAS